MDRALRRAEGGKSADPTAVGLHRAARIEVDCNPRNIPTYPLIAMATLMFLAFLFLIVCVFGAATLALKLMLKIALLPFKLLFLPIIAVVVIVKFAVLLAVGVAFGAIILAILIPLAVLFLIFVGPILLISALT